MKELISVIVPVYNVKDLLERCLSSIINQSYKELEILVIDDGSTDGSGSVCEDCAQKDKRIKVYHKKTEDYLMLEILECREQRESIFYLLIVMM